VFVFKYENVGTKNKWNERSKEINKNKTYKQTNINKQTNKQTYTNINKHKP